MHREIDEFVRDLRDLVRGSGRHDEHVALADLVGHAAVPGGRLGMWTGPLRIDQRTTYRDRAFTVEIDIEFGVIVVAEEWRRGGAIDLVRLEWAPADERADECLGIVRRFAVRFGLRDHFRHVSRRAID